MSWSVTAMGKGDAVARAVGRDLGRLSKMAEPEETAKQKAGEIVAAVCAAAPDLGFVVRASGSQWSDNKGVIKGSNLEIHINSTEFAE